MAILSKIRQRSLLLILIIALALFSFVLTDLIKNGTLGDNSSIGSINGNKIDYNEFMAKVANVEKQQQGVSTTQAMNSVWEQEVRNSILNDQYEKAGIVLGKDQIINVIKNHPQYSQTPQFLNAAGQFDEKKFQEYIKSLQNAPDKNAWSQWLAFEKDLENYAKEQIYSTLIKSSVYSTKVEGKAKYEKETAKVDFDYVSVAYSTVSDDQVKITDEEILAYMKKNPKKYKHDNTRSLEFVLVENKPSVEDENAMKTKLDNVIKGGIVYVNGKNDTIPSFASANNVGEFVNKYSEIKFDSTYVSKQDLNPQFADALFNLAPGQVYGPYTDNGFSKLTRLVNKKNGSSAKVSHILISFKEAKTPTPGAKISKAEAKVKAEDLLKQINTNPSSFAMLAMTNSDDAGSKNNGGVYDNVKPGQMVKSFDDFLFNKPVGATGIVETDFGFHVMKNEAKYDAVLLGSVSFKVQPSEKTENANYDKANKIESDAVSSTLEAAAKKAGLKVAPVTSVKAYDESINGLGTQRSVVTWAFNEDTSVGDVKRFDVPQVGFVVVKLKSKNDEGILPIDLAKMQVEPLIKNEKKAAIIRKKMNGTTLEAVAKSSGSSVMNAVGSTMANPAVPNLGYEPKVIGTAFGLKTNQTSKLIDGNAAVFMVKTKTIAGAPKINNYTSHQDQLSQQSKGSAQYRVIQSLKNDANIEDNRGRY